MGVSPTALAREPGWLAKSAGPLHLALPLVAAAALRRSSAVHLSGTRTLQPSCREGFGSMCVRHDRHQGLAAGRPLMCVSCECIE